MFFSFFENENDFHFQFWVPQTLKENNLKKRIIKIFYVYLIFDHGKIHIDQIIDQLKKEHIMTFSIFNSDHKLLIILPTLIAVRNYVKKMTITLDDDLYYVCNIIE